MKRATIDLIFIGVVSAAVLAYELVLTRILAVHYWSYFASMIVSLAMLGFAVSGTVLFLVARRPAATGRLVPWCTLGLVLALPLCPRISEQIECMPLVVLWDPRQLLLFAAHYLVLSLPFLFGGFIIGHFFVAGRLPAGHVYFANMLGSGSGILIALLGLSGMAPSQALSWVAVPVLAAAWPRHRGSARYLLLLLLCLLPLPAFLAPSRPVVSEYKGLSKLRLMPDATTEYAGWNRFGYLTVVDSRTIRYAPGLSLTFAGRIPPQKAIFTNGDNMEVVCGNTHSPASLRTYFDAMLSGIVYRFHEQPRMLVAGAGGGLETLGGTVHDASQIDAIENNSGIVRLMTGPLAPFSGRLYQQPNVRLVRTSARAFANRTTNRYDLVRVPAKGSLFASATGTSAQDPNYLLSREALVDFFRRLAPGGVLAMETWINLPPRHTAKLFATAVQALRTQDLNPGAHLVVLRSLRTSLLLLFRDPVTDTQIETVNQFCSDRSFDRVYHPGIRPEDANRFNYVEGAPYYQLCTALLEDPEAAYTRHLFRIRPPSDNQPYFAHFFKWRALPQLFSKTGQNVAIHVGWGYMFLLITLVQAVPLGLLLILLPLAVTTHRSRSQGARTGVVVAYFAALGLAFMFLELAAIQQFARFLPHPVHAFGITIGIVLVFSGLGALASSCREIGDRSVFTALAVGIATHLLWWTLAIHNRSTIFFHVDVITVAVIAFFMGMPFPRGIERVRSRAPHLVPWAWGINGFTSVIAVLAAGLVSLSWGLPALVILAAVFYVVAGTVLPRLEGKEEAD